MKQPLRSLPCPSHATMLIVMASESPLARPMSMLASRHASYETGTQSGSESRSLPASRSVP